MAMRNVTALVPCKISKGGSPSERVGEVATAYSGAVKVVGDARYFHPSESDPGVGEVEAHVVREDIEVMTIDVIFPDNQFLRIRREGVRLLHEAMPQEFIKRALGER